MFYLKKDLTKRRKPPLFWNPLKSHIDLSRTKDGGVNCLTFAVYVPFHIRSENYLKEALKMVNLLEKFTERNRDIVEIAKTVSDIERIIQEGKLAATIAVEGGHILDGKIENLETLKQRGIIYITLTHLHSNNIAESSFLRLHRARGLTDFGREAVVEMERLGILIDVAHCSEKAFWEILEITRRSKEVLQHREESLRRSDKSHIREGRNHWNHLFSSLSAQLEFVWRHSAFCKGCRTRCGHCWDRLRSHWLGF
jgi:microsomal dipeptidase-like Zn-dependent dipeptidase